ncbi:MAG: Tol biopolymer transport system [Bacteroidetes bacterium]|nr:Tol biopolymer transport system [Bacteroidota bacterium]
MTMEPLNGANRFIHMQTFHSFFEGFMGVRASLLRRIGFLGFVVLGCLSSPASAQDDIFGQNKVQYMKFTWYFLQSDHFDVYFADEGKPLAEFTAAAAESAYASINKSFRYQIVNRIPIIVYNSHNAFQQTNVVSEYLEEGIGGVTELFKNRVVLPFEGDYKKFRHVIHHELVHAVLNDMFYGGSIQSIISNNISLQLPLWFNEGLAEYEALKWDTDSDMFLRDATCHEYLPAINRLYGYFAYRGGQSVWNYIARKYGDQKIGEILNRIKSTRSVEAGFKGSLGLGVEELSERWQKEQKVLYWPDIAKREEPADYARRLTDHRKDGGFYNTSPVISPQGDRVAFISNRNDYFDVFMMSATDGAILDKLAGGNTTNNFEELHLLTPGMSWSPDGKKLALATKAGESDAIQIIDVNGGDNDKLTFAVDGIASVEWSPKGDVLAFVGYKAQQSDIYLYDFTTKALTNLTADIFSDSYPAWSPDGRTVYFSSDRGSAVGGGAVMRGNSYEQLDAFSINIDTRQLTRITEWPNSDETSKVISPDGKRMLVVSDRNGINNVYSVTLEDRQFKPITNSLSGVYQLSLSRDGSKMAFSSLNNAGFDIFLMRNPFERDLKVADLESTEFFKTKFVPVVAKEPQPEVAEEQPAPAQADTTQRYGNNIQIDFSNYVFSDSLDESVPHDSTIARLPQIADNVDPDGTLKVNKYKLNFTPDIIYGNAGYDTFYGVTGSTVMAFSDLLGDHQIIFVTNLLLDLKNSDYGLQYYYMPNRVDFGIGGFHSARFVIINDMFGGSLYRFRTYGGAISASYPFDRFNRMNFGLNLYSVSKENMDYQGVPIEKRMVLVPQVSYTHDNSLWGFTAPVNGSRFRFNVFGTPKLGATGLSFVNVDGDYRTYLRLGKNYNIAVRMAGGGSFGKNPQKYMIGGVESWINPTFEGGYVPLENAEDYLFLQTGLPLRGYNYNAAIGSKYALFNFEFRYPFFALLQAGPLPIGLQSIGGAMFFDAGSAWNNEKEFVAFTKDSRGNTVTKDLLMGMGTGARIFFLAFLVRLDVAWAWNYNGFSEPKYYFSLGADF